MISINLSYVLICFLSVWITPVLLNIFDKTNIEYYKFAGYCALVYLFVQLVFEVIF